jgi:hypothetical protein
MGFLRALKERGLRMSHIGPGKRVISCGHLPFSCHISGIFCRSKLFSRYHRIHRLQTNGNYTASHRLFTHTKVGSQPAIVCHSVTMQACCDSLLLSQIYTAGDVIMPARSSQIYTAGDVIMPARSYSSSQQALPAMDVSWDKSVV